MSLKTSCARINRSQQDCKTWSLSHNWYSSWRVAKDTSSMCGCWWKTVWRWDV